MVISVEQRYLQPFTGNGDVCKWVKNSREYSKQKYKQTHSNTAFEREGVTRDFGFNRLIWRIVAFNVKQGCWEPILNRRATLLA